MYRRSVWIGITEKQVLFEQCIFIIMPRLGQDLRNQAIGMHRAGVAKIATIDLETSMTYQSLADQG